MTENEFEIFIDQCYLELEDKQKFFLNHYGIGQYDEYWYDQASESIQFKKEGRVELEFGIVPVGSWSGNSKSWMWAWANKTVREELKTQSLKIKQLGDATGCNVFEQEAFEAEEITAHELTAMAVHHLDAMGMYIVPSGNLKIFLALTSLR